MNKKALWITRTAVFVALLIVLQAVTAPLGNTFLTGSIVNLLLIVSTMTCGYASGAAVAVISPIMAKLVGIGPLWSIIPFIIIGNLVLITLWHFIGNMPAANKHAARIIALICAAVAKFLALYIGIVKIAVPFLLGLPEKQAQVISTMFSVPQLITALIGGAVAFIILPTLQKAIKSRKE